MTVKQFKLLSGYTVRRFEHDGQYICPSRTSIYDCSQCGHEQPSVTSVSRASPRIVFRSRRCSASVFATFRFSRVSSAATRRSLVGSFLRCRGNIAHSTRRVGKRLRQRDTPPEGGTRGPRTRIPVVTPTRRWDASKRRHRSPPNRSRCRSSSPRLLSAESGFGMSGQQRGSNSHGDRDRPARPTHRSGPIGVCGSCDSGLESSVTSTDCSSPDRTTVRATVSPGAVSSARYDNSCA